MFVPARIQRHRVNLLDVWVDAIGRADALARIESFVEGRTPHQVVTVNVDFLRLARERPIFRDVLNAADLAVPDGMPLLWAARLLGNPLPERVTGVDLIGACAELAARRGYRPFFLGAAPGVADTAADRLRARMPGLTMAGTYAPPRGSCDPDEDRRMIDQVTDARPDMLFVALGAPRQDEWIRAHLAELDVPVCMGVGGAFDLLAGHVRRAPAALQAAGCEWLWRLAQEPHRLARRYLVDDVPVAFRVLGQWAATRPEAAFASEAALVDACSADMAPSLVVATGSPLAIGSPLVARLREAA